MRRRLIAGNWKMNTRSASAVALAERVRDGVAPGRGAEVVLCPPAVYLSAVARRLEGGEILLGAQNVCERSDGAFTGELSAEMLVDVGCAFVIVGHSERRAGCPESDEAVARKYRRAREAGLAPILCVGESLAEREAGHSAEVVARQLSAVADLVGAEGFRHGVIAYEPVWAIGTGHSAAPEQAQEIHAFLRTQLEARWGARPAQEIRILYGGSVKAENAGPLFSMPDVDGGLIGGASLDADEFTRICAWAE